MSLSSTLTLSATELVQINPKMQSSKKNYFVWPFQGNNKKFCLQWIPKQKQITQFSIILHLFYYTFNSGLLKLWASNPTPFLIHKQQRSKSILEEETTGSKASKLWLNSLKFFFCLYSYLWWKSSAFGLDLIIQRTKFISPNIHWRSRHSCLTGATVLSMNTRYCLENHSVVCLWKIARS